MLVFAPPSPQGRGGPVPAGQDLCYVSDDHGYYSGKTVAVTFVDELREKHSYLDCSVSQSVNLGAIHTRRIGIVLYLIAAGSLETFMDGELCDLRNDSKKALRSCPRSEGGPAP